MGNLTPNFDIEEFDSKDGTPVPDRYKPNVLGLAWQLEKLRTALGDKPFTINSGYRSPEHNERVGGVTNSQHLYGRAADFTVAARPPAQVYCTARRLIREGKMRDGGLGVGPGLVHYDTGPAGRRWHYGQGFPDCSIYEEDDVAEIEELKDEIKDLQTALKAARILSGLANVVARQDRAPTRLLDEAWYVINSLRG